MVLKGTRLLDVEKHKIIDLAKHGIRGAEIARLVDRSTRSVYKLFGELGISVKPEERTEEQIKTAHSLVRHEDKLSPTQGVRRRLKAVMEPSLIAAHYQPVDTAEDGETIEYQCVDCGEPWAMTEKHLAWFVGKDLTVPKRCEPCRSARKGTHDGFGRPSDSQTFHRDVVMGPPTYPWAQALDEEFGWEESSGAACERKERSTLEALRGIEAIVAEVMAMVGTAIGDITREVSNA